MSGRIRAHLMVGIAQHTKFFPDFALRSLPSRWIRNGWKLLNVLWKSATQFGNVAFQGETIRVCSGPINS